MSGSNFTLTANYNLMKPNVGGDDDQWGGRINTDLDTLDTLIKTVETKANTVPAASTTLPIVDGTAAAGVATTYARGDHVHPTDTSRAAVSAIPAASTTLPLIEGTAAIGSSMNYARADHVHPAAASGVTSFNTRSGAVTLTTADVTGAGGAPLAAPVFTGDARAVTATYGDNDTSIATTAFVQSAVAPTLNDTGRNLLHNGTFAVAQRGAGPWTASGSYTADRWIIYTSLDTDSLNVTALTDTDRAQIGDETAQYAIANTFTGNANAASYSVLQQHIERQRRLAGRTVTVSFWAWAGTAGLKLGVAFSQNFGTGGSPSAQVSPNGTAVTLAVAWTRYTVTLTVPSVSGKTFGTNGDDYFGLEFWYSCGASNNAHAGSIGVQSGGVILWGIQLEIGSVATPLAKREYAEELRLAQRYYQAGQVSFGGYGTAATTINAYYPLGVAMRAAPTLVVATPSYTNASGLSADQPSPGGFRYFVTVTATGMAYTSGGWTASADL